MTKITAQLLSSFFCVIFLLTGCTTQKSSSSGVPNAENPKYTTESATGKYIQQDATPDVLKDGVISDFRLTPNNEVHLLGFDENGSLFYVVSQDGSHWEDCPTPSIPEELNNQDKTTLRLALDMEGGFWVISSENTDTVYHISDDGKQQTIALSELKDHDTIMRLLPGDNSQLVVASVAENKIVWTLLDSSGKISNSFSPSFFPDFYDFMDGKLYAVHTETQQLNVFEPDSGKEIDTIHLPLEEKELRFTVGSISSQEELCFSNTNGIQKVAIGGNMIQVAVENSSYAYASTDAKMLSLYSADDGVFWLACLLHGSPRIFRYHYDDDAPTVLEDTLYIWAMEETVPIKTAISIFAERNPECELLVEYGRTNDNEALTENDIVRLLNTQLLSGDVPDVLMLDGLPVDALIKNGFLQDISDAIDQPAFYPNLLSGYAFEDEIYGVPTLFSVPVFLYDQEETKPPIDASFSTFSDLIPYFDTPEKAYVDGYKEIFDTFYLSGSSQLYDGLSINKDVLYDLLYASKEILDGQGITEEYRQPISVSETTLGSERIVPEDPPSLTAYEIMPDLKYSYGIAGSTLHLGSAAFGKHNSAILPMPGKSFLPSCVFSIPTGAQNKAMATEFFGALTDDLMVDMSRLGYGMSVKQGADVEYMNMRISDEDNIDAWEEFYLIDPRGYDWNELYSSYENVAILDVVLKEIVYNQAVLLYTGTQDIDTTVSSIINETTLYFAERQ